VIRSRWLRRTIFIALITLMALPGAAAASFVAFGVPYIQLGSRLTVYIPTIYGGTQKNDVQISIDGKCRCMDNIFIDRLWRSLKYDEVYLKSYDSVSQARKGIGNWIVFYNTIRRHQGMDDQTPDSVYFDGRQLPLAA